MRNLCPLNRNAPAPSHQTSVGQNNRAPNAAVKATSTQSTVQNKGKAPMTSPKQGQRLYEMRRSDEPDAPICKGTLYVRSTDAFLLFDSGATHSFISESCV